MSKFKIWIDDNKVLPGDAGNVLASDVLETDVQRINGFKSGTDVSSKRVNSILRQNSLVSKALMDLSDNNTFDYNSTLENIKTAIKNLSNYTVNFTQASALSNITSGEKLSTTLGKISKQFNSLSNFMKEDESGVNLSATNATNAILNADSTYSGFTRDVNNQLKVGEEIVCIKKPIWVGNQLCPKTTETTIQLSGVTLQQQDTLEVEFIYSVTSNRPMRIIVQVARSSHSFSSPIFYVHLLGSQYLELKTYDYTSITCGGSISTSSNRDYDSGVRILSISKIQYKSNVS